MFRRPFIRLIPLVFVALVLTLYIPVRAQGGAVMATALVGLNVRAGPGLQFDRVTALLAGETVQLDGRSRGWYHFDEANSGRAGWVLGTLLRITGDPRTLPDLTEPPFVIAATPPPLLSGSYNGVTINIVPAPPGAVIATALANMIIRGGPGIQYERLGGLLAGQSVVIDGRSGDWFRFSYPNSFVKGWLWSGLVKITGDITTLPNVTFPPENQPVP